MTTLTKWLGGLALALLLGLAGSTYMISKAQKSGAEAAAKADRLELLLQEASAREAALKAEKAAIHAINDEQARLIEQLKATRPVVRNLPPIPETCVDLVKALSELGLQEGTRVIDLEVKGDYKVTMPGGSLFHYWDAEKVVEWGYQARRVPDFEKRQAADQVIIDRYGGLVLGLKTEIAKTEGALAESDRKYVLKAEQFDAVKVQNGALIKEMEVKAFRTKLVFSIAIPLTAYVAYRLAK